MRSRVIPETTKKLVAAAEGCCPGASVEISCEYCLKRGRLAWVIFRPGQSRIQLSDGFEWDHDTPFSRGGSNEFGNVWPMCRLCNRRKGGYPPDFFAFVVWPELKEIAPTEWARVQAAYL